MPPPESTSPVLPIPGTLLLQPHFFFLKIFFRGCHVSLFCPRLSYKAWSGFSTFDKAVLLCSAGKQWDYLRTTLTRGCTVPMLCCVSVSGGVPFLVHISLSWCFLTGTVCCQCCRSPRVPRVLSGIWDRCVPDMASPHWRFLCLRGWIGCSDGTVCVSSGSVFVFKGKQHIVDTWKCVAFRKPTSISGCLKSWRRPVWDIFSSFRDLTIWYGGIQVWWSGDFNFRCCHLFLGDGNALGY